MVLITVKIKRSFDFPRQKKRTYFSQEMHWKTESECFIRSCRGYSAWSSGAETNKNGVAILFNNNFEHIRCKGHRRTTWILYHCGY